MSAHVRRQGKLGCYGQTTPSTADVGCDGSVESSDNSLFASCVCVALREAPRPSAKILKKSVEKLGRHVCRRQEARQ